MSQTNLKNDNCHKGQHQNENKTIFDYMIDKNMFINNNECADYTPSFLSYIPIGIPKMNVEIEDELRGSNRRNTLCSSLKYNPTETFTQSDILTQKSVDLYPNNKKICKTPFRILPNGYIGN